MTPWAPVLSSEKPRLIEEQGECSLQDFRPGTNQPDEAGRQGLPGAQVTAHLVALLYLLEMRLPGRWAGVLLCRQAAQAGQHLSFDMSQVASLAWPFAHGSLVGPPVTLWS